MNLALTVPAYYWVGLAASTFLAIVAATTLVEKRIGWRVLSGLLGGTGMVFGYLNYNTFVLALWPYSPTEVPFNVAQALFGLVMAVSLARRVVRLNRRQEARNLSPGRSGWGPV